MVKQSMNEFEKSFTFSLCIFYLAGAAVCLILAVNLSFVHWWLSISTTNEIGLKMVVSISLLIVRLTYSVVTPVGVVGYRLLLGTSIMNGISYVILALGLGSVFGLVALPMATSLSCLFTTVACGIYLQRHVFRITVRTILISWLMPLLTRAASLRSHWLHGLEITCAMRFFSRQWPS